MQSAWQDLSPRLQGSLSPADAEDRSAAPPPPFCRFCLLGVGLNFLRNSLCVCLGILKVYDLSRLTYLGCAYLGCAKAKLSPETGVRDPVLFLHAIIKSLAFLLAHLRATTQARSCGFLSVCVCSANTTNVAAVGVSWPQALSCGLRLT